MRASSMNENDSLPVRYDRQSSKSRPRPGTQAGNTSNALIAPPPSSQKKNSSSEDFPDLISFSSPPPTTRGSDIIDFCSQQR